MSASNVGQKVGVNFIWSFAERVGANLISLVVSIILARLILPSEFARIAIILVFINFLAIFVDCGFASALIQKRDVDDTDYSSVFYFNLFASFIIYWVLFFAAPYIANFYHDPLLTTLIRVVSLTVICSALCIIQNAYLSRNLLFKRLFYAKMFGTVCSGIVGVEMAYSGYGIWALVAQCLTSNGVSAVALWLIVKWRPRLLFSLERLRGLISYGWKLVMASVLDVGYRDVRQLIIGKMYTYSDLAFYNRGDTMPNLIITNACSSLSAILFPVMSQVQDDKVRLKSITRRALVVTTYIVSPLMMGLAFTSQTIVELLLTAKWLPCVPFMCIFCVMYMFYPIHMENLNAIKAMGHSGIFLKLEIMKKVVGLIALLVTMWISPLAMAYSLLFVGVCSMIINSWPNKKLIDYSYLEQVTDFLPNMLRAVFMGACTWCVGWILRLPLIAELIIQILFGAGLYILLSIIFKVEAYYYVLDMIHKILAQKREAR